MVASSMYCSLVVTWPSITLQYYCYSYYYYYYYYYWQPLWSSCQSSWLQFQRSRLDSRSYQIFWEVVGLEWVPLSLVSTTEELLGRKSSGYGLESREYGHSDPSWWLSSNLYPQKLTLASPTSGCRSVGIVRSLTKATELLLLLLLLFAWEILSTLLQYWFHMSSSRACTPLTILMVTSPENTWQTTTRVGQLFNLWREAPVLLMWHLIARKEQKHWPMRPLRKPIPPPP
jgi:hypothetical protein